MRNGRTDAFLGILGREAIENRTYSITAKRIISGLVLKYLNGECFVIWGFYKYTLLASTEFNLTVPGSLFQSRNMLLVLFHLLVTPKRYQGQS